MSCISKDSPVYYLTSTAREDEPFLMDIDQVTRRTGKRGTDQVLSTRSVGLNLARRFNAGSGDRNPSSRSDD